MSAWINCSRSRPCPICEDIGRGAKERQRCAFTEDGAHHCFRSGGKPLPGWVIVTPMAAHGGTIYRASGDARVRQELDPAEIERQRQWEIADAREKILKARKLWESAAGISTDLAAKYFWGRLQPPHGCSVEDPRQSLMLPLSIRFVEALPFYDEAGFGRPGPAVLCSMTDPTGSVTAVHRLYLDAASCVDGAPVKRKKTDAAKQMLGKPKGSAVRFPGSLDVVIICEGIETGRALWLATGFTVLACFSGAGIMSVDLSPEEAASPLKIVAGDHDELNPLTDDRPGERMARIAANRLLTLHGGVVRVCIPGPARFPELLTPDGTVLCGTKGVDWEDVARFLSLMRVRDGVMGDDAAVPAASTGGMGGGLGLVEQDGEGEEEHAFLEPGDLARARQCVLSCFMRGQAGERFSVLYDYQASRWYRFLETHWEVISDEQLRSLVLRWAEPYYVQLTGRDGEGRVKKASISAKAAMNVVLAMQEACGEVLDFVPAWVPPTITDKIRPRWEFDGNLPRIRDPKNVVALKSGLLSIDDWLEGRVVIRPHTSRYVSIAEPQLDLDAAKLQAYLDRDPLCEERGGKLVNSMAPCWMDTIRFASDEDEVWQECLGRAFGIALTPDTSLERIYFMEGPPGSAKGTIFEGMISMLGEDLVATSSLTDVCDKFELSTWRGRRVVGMTDASVGRWTDPAHAVEQIKRLSGGDPMPVETKYVQKEAFWRPNVHLWIVSNELLKLPDPSLSLRRRLVAIPTFKPIGDRQDPRVKQKIKSEGAGIMVWALCHLKALMADRAAGRVPFVMSAGGKAAVEIFSRQSSSISAFVGDCCRVEATAEVSAPVLRRVYEEWCKDQGIDHPMTEDKFGQQLRSIVPGLARKRASGAGGGPRPYYYTGVRPLVQGEDGSKPCVRLGVKVYNYYDVADFGFVTSSDTAQINMPM